jgi:streptogramin lyase
MNAIRPSLLSRLGTATLAVAATTASFAAALPAQEEAYWIANRGSLDVQKVSAYGEVLATIPLSAALRAAYVAPDGKIWVQKFITTSFVIMNADGSNQKTIMANGGAYVGDIAFDAQGNGLVLVTGRSATPLGIQIYDKDGNYQKILPLSTPTPLSMTQDANGDLWIGLRVGPPTIIAKIELKTGKETLYTAPTTTTTLGGNVALNWPGIGKTGTVWTVGDRSNELLELDPSTTPPTWKTHFPDGSATTFGSIAADFNNTLWLSDWSSRKLVHFDIATAANLKTIPFVDQPAGIALDGRGKVLMSVKAATTSELWRIHPTTYVVEQVTATGNNPGQGPTSGYATALVRNLFGDADGDKSADFSEMSSGTSLFDPQSNALTDLRVKGSNKLGSTVDIQVSGGGNFVLGFALKRLPTALPIPGWVGNLRVDPSTLIVLLAGTAPHTFANINLPNTPAAVGFIMHLQSAHDLSGTTHLANDDGIKLFQ